MVYRSGRVTVMIDAEEALDEICDEQNPSVGSTVR
jgi:hypothetical protein